MWYRVKFDENTDLKEAAGRLAKLGEVAKVQANSHIQRAYRVDAIGVMLVRVHCDRRRQHVLLRQEAPSPIPDWHINGIIITVAITLLTIRTY